MKKILYSVASLGIVAAIAIGATGAFFSDEEKSEGNIFQAGAIDLKVDYQGYYNKVVDQNPNAGNWVLTDLTKEHKFFDFADVKPGDFGEGTISLHVYNNEAWACATINPTMNDDNGSTEPELEVDEPDSDSIFDGELAQNMWFKIWADTDCNNIFDAGEHILTEGPGPITPRTWAIADSTTPHGALNPEQTYCLGVEWSIPDTVGNIIQTDKYMADISFYVEQARNNGTFVCPVQEGFPTNTLRLENEEETESGPWTVLDGDEIYADLTWSDGPTFNYTLTGKGLAPSTNYSLIYYADGWPGNNPGALLGTFTSESDGTVPAGTAGNPDLGMDLPHPNDGNYAIGAKIWLIPSSAYDAGTKSVTTWPPDFNTWLFEGNVYIQYNDTDAP